MDKIFEETKSPSSNISDISGLFSEECEGERRADLATSTVKEVCGERLFGADVTNMCADLSESTTGRLDFVMIISGILTVSDDVRISEIFGLSWSNDSTCFL